MLHINMQTEWSSAGRDLDDLVRAAADHIDSVIADVDGVDRVTQWAIELTDQRAVVRLPETDLTVGARRDDLVFEWMIRHILEQCVDSQHVTTRSLSAVDTQPYINSYTYNAAISNSIFITVPETSLYTAETLLKTTKTNQQGQIQDFRLGA